MSKLDEFTWPGAQPQPTDVVVVPPGASWEDALALALAQAKLGKTVRIVGDGAALRIRNATLSPSIGGTELGALLAEDLGTETLSARTAIRAFVDDLFRDVLPGTQASLIFYGTACTRLFQGFIYAHPLARALRRAFPGSVFHVVGSHWPGIHILRELGADVRASSGSRPPIRSLRRLPFGVLALAALCGSAVSACRDRWAAREPRKQLRRPRRLPSPRLYVALIPDWARINWHVIHSVAEPMLESERAFGLAVVGNLKPGTRSEVDMSTSGKELWTGLGPLARQLSQLDVLQCVQPERSRGFWRSLTSGLWAGWRAGRRAGTTRELSIAGVKHRPAMDAIALAKLVSIDIVRARMSWDATTAACAERDLRGTSVVFAANGPPELAAADVVLQSKGATTYHLFHGGLGDDWVGAAEHPSTFHIAWTENDSRCLSRIRTGVQVAGMPRRIPFRKRPLLPERLLLMSSYVHRDYVGLRDYSAFEDEIVQLARLLRSNRATSDLRIVWRPHPASRPGEIDRRFQTVSELGVELSRGQSLEDDVDAADVIVTNMSTVFAEALLAGAPVFLHVMPMHWDAPGSDFIDSKRRFFWAHDGAEKIAALVEERRNGRPDPAPEHYAKRRLWGERECPSALGL
ncbi:MAG: hypothetical protein AMXMBFR34_28400 [Myxococcaceae bacterium]